MSTGKHMICDLSNIKNVELLNSMEKLTEMFDEICKTHQYNVLHRTHHQFEPQGITILYMLSESHLSIHTFPEKNYAALDLYTCREYPDDNVYLDIQEYLKKMFESEGDQFKIIERSYHSMKTVIK